MLDAHREEALAAIRRRVGDVDDAQDCVQDAVMRLVQRGDLDPDRVGSLLSRTAVHLAIDRRRARRREEQAAARLRVDAARQVAWPEQVVTDRADAARVLRAVDTLPPREREVMRLRLVAGLTVAETARLLGVTYKSIEGTYTRARARIRLILGTALAWLAARLRRLSTQPSAEPLAAGTAALVAVLLVAPIWQHMDGAPRGPGDSTAGLSLAGSTGHGPQGEQADTPAPPSAVGRIVLDGGSGRGGGSGPGGGDGGRRTFFTTGPLPSLPNPYTGKNQSPGTLLTISGVGPIDPAVAVAGTEKCVEQGGPQETVVVSTSEISVTGGCPG